jgi:photosystem II stability/assembly factor-like uncharacterized protein
MNIRAGVILSFTFLVIAAAQTAARKPAAAKQSTAAAQPKFKAVWEPVPFNKDINLNAIACVAAETCWVVGDKSTILHTTDGGKTWQVQLGGDTEATEDPLVKVFFLDAKHGWASTDRGKILGTRDGSTWAELTRVSGTSKGVWFLSPQIGLQSENPDSTVQSTLRRSEDGGKTWNPVTRCGVETTIDGLPRKLGCFVNTMQFFSPSTGLLGGSATAGAANLPVFGKTADGGQTWSLAVIPDSKRPVTDLKFWSEKDGIAVLDRSEEVHWTADGGATWTKSLNPQRWPAYYGVGEGKIIVGVGEGGGAAYSFNGGRSFTSRPMQLPAYVNAVTFPDARHGYLVGRNAMVYRYRIVPVEYTAAGLLAAMAP